MLQPLKCLGLLGYGEAGRIFTEGLRVHFEQVTASNTLAVAQAVAPHLRTGVMTSVLLYGIKVPRLIGGA